MALYAEEIYCITANGRAIYVAIGNYGLSFKLRDNRRCLVDVYYNGSRTQLDTNVNTVRLLLGCVHSLKNGEFAIVYISRVCKGTLLFSITISSNYTII